MVRKSCKIRALKVKGQKCVICLDNYGGRKWIRQLECLHHFHHTCLKRWAKCDNQWSIWLGKYSTCPICRAFFSF